MAKLELNVAETVKVTAAEPVARVVFKQKSPNAWDIKPGTKTEIIAKSDLGDKFEGTIAEFNKLLRA